MKLLPLTVLVEEFGKVRDTGRILGANLIQRRRTCSEEAEDGEGGVLVYGTRRGEGRGRIHFTPPVLSYSSRQFEGSSDAVEN